MGRPAMIPDESVDVALPVDIVGQILLRPTCSTY